MNVTLSNIIVLNCTLFNINAHYSTLHLNVATIMLISINKCVCLKH